ncbi:hypothetical protein [Levilactobacillus sp. 244-2]|uniref:hypothetical protein n=1 Tax=Levilactobacillus sp. 244-2 TaxID=2799569 RepID=UPI001951CE63|nr:hypothetical protein [Levilactobacillus sp. 244-2]
MKLTHLAITGLALITLVPLGIPTTANAKSTTLPRTIRNHTWYRLTDGSQGGFHGQDDVQGEPLHHQGQGD